MTTNTKYVSMTHQERQRLLVYIEGWFTSSYNTRERLFDDMNASIALLEIAKQIKDNPDCLTVTGYQAKLITSVIFDNEKRWNLKTNKVYLPDDFKGRTIYNLFDKFADK